MRKGRKQEVMFDVSRYDEPDIIVESEVGAGETEADTSTLTAYTLLDTSRRPEEPLAKLPDDNMNSEAGRGGRGVLALQPTLQPNG